MPQKPLSPCRETGCCAKAVPGYSYCEEHLPAHIQPDRYDKERPTTTQRGYGYRWQKYRLKYLAAHPFCVMCLQEGKYVKATDVDHIKPHRGDPKLMWDPANLRSLCRFHHSVKTGLEDTHGIVYTYPWQR